MQQLASAARKAACALALVPVFTVHAQSHAMVSPHVPAQILTAKRVFVSNAGGDTYGAETYFRLTKYDGGPNRFYNSYYSSLKSWGRYDLVDTPSDADIILQIHFANPIVEHQISDNTTPDGIGGVIGGVTSSSTHDAQLDLTVLDPKTRVTLWTLTEHIEPARSQSANDTNFDQAVARIVDDTKTLADATPAVVARGDSQFGRASIPPGAIDVADRQAHSRNAGIGAMAGLVVGALADIKASQSACPSVTQCSVRYGEFRNDIFVGLGATALGALVGWLWPVHH